LWFLQGVFSENRVFDVVFLWISCGELHGKRGAKTTPFVERRIGQLFEIYFWTDHCENCATANA
jgi:hypothetical protein